MVLDRPPALLLRTRDLFWTVPVGMAVREGIGRAAIVAERALVVHGFAGELRVRGDAADVAGGPRLVVDRVPAVIAFLVADPADGVLHEDALSVALNRGIRETVLISGR